jgi:hypothetical protein
MVDIILTLRLSELRDKRAINKSNRIPLSVAAERIASRSWLGAFAINAINCGTTIVTDRTRAFTEKHNLGGRLVVIV